MPTGPEAVPIRALNITMGWIWDMWCSKVCREIRLLSCTGRVTMRNRLASATVQLLTLVAKASVLSPTILEQGVNVVQRANTFLRGLPSGSSGKSWSQMFLSVKVINSYCQIGIFTDVDGALVSLTIITSSS